MKNTSPSKLNPNECQNMLTDKTGDLASQSASDLPTMPTIPNVTKPKTKKVLNFGLNPGIPTKDIDKSTVRPNSIPLNESPNNNSIYMKRFFNTAPSNNISPKVLSNIKFGIQKPPYLGGKNPIPKIANSINKDGNDYNPDEFTDARLFPGFYFEKPDENKFHIIKKNVINTIPVGLITDNHDADFTNYIYKARSIKMEEIDKNRLAVESCHNIPDAVINTEYNTGSGLSSYETRILKKYTHGGYLTTFKGNVETKKFREHLLFKNVVKDLFLSLETTSSNISELKLLLANKKEKLRVSKLNLDKIIKELEGYFIKEGIQNVFDIKKKSELGFVTNFNGIVGNQDYGPIEDCQLLEEKYFKKDLPMNATLMNQKRYRELIEHYELNSHLLSTCLNDTSKFKSELSQKQSKLQKLESIEFSLREDIRKLEDADRVLHSELNVVAKHRAIQFIKNQSLIKRNYPHKKKNMIKKTYKPDPEIEKKMKRFFIESQKKKYVSPKDSKLVNHKDTEKIVAKMENNDKLMNGPSFAIKHKPGEIKDREMAIIKNVLDQEYPIKKKLELKKDNVNPDNGISMANLSMVEMRKLPTTNAEDFLGESINHIQSNFEEKEIKIITQPKIPLIRVKNIQSNDNWRPKFTFDPPVVHLKDLCSDTEISTQVRVINTTGIVNSFKVSQIPSRIEEHLSLEYAFGGKITPGEHIILKLNFKGTKDFLEDSILGFSCKILFTCQYGPDFSLPLRFSAACSIPIVRSLIGYNGMIAIYKGEKIDFLQKTTKSQSLIGNKKIKLPFAKSHEDSLDIDFGTCTFGEERSFYLKISNQGFLPTTFNVLGLDDSIDTIQDKTKPLDFIECKLSTSPDLNLEVLDSRNLKETDDCSVKVPQTPSLERKNKVESVKTLEKIRNSKVIHDSQIEESKWEVKCGSFEIVYTDTNLNSYGDVIFRINFKPIQKSSYQDDKEKVQDRTLNTQNEYSQFVIKFPSHLQNITVSCKGTGKTMPFFTSRQVLDYKCCVANILYQDHIFIHNQYRLSRIYSLDFGDDEVISNELSKTVHPPDFGRITVIPVTTFIQAQDFIKLWIKIQLDKVFIKDELSYTFHILFSEPSTNKDIKLPVTIKAKVLVEEIKLCSVGQTQILDFGLCGLNERKELKLEITNISEFPQLIQCTDPENFKVFPSGSDSLIRLEPYEMATRKVFFEPKKVGQYFEVIKYSTKFNQVFEITCKGIAYEPPVVFDKTRLVFDTVSLGSSKTERFGLKMNSFPTDLNGNLINLEGKEIEFEILKPILISTDESGGITENESIEKVERNILDDISPELDEDVIHVWPCNGVVKPKGLTFLEIIVNLPSKYSDNRSPINNKPETKSNLIPSNNGDMLKEPFVSELSSSIVQHSKSKKEKNGKVPEIEQATTSETEFPLTPFQQKLFSVSKPKLIALIPCISKFKISEEARMESLINGRIPIEPSLNDQSENGMISRTSFMQIELPIIERKIELIEPKCQKLDFEYVAIGQRKVKNLVFTAKEITILKQRGLSPLGPFYLVKSLRNIEAGKNFTVPILFEPTEISRFATFVDFWDGPSTIRVQLCGISIKPELHLEPKERMDMGDVCVFDQNTQLVKITNPTMISLKLQILLASEESEIQDIKFGSMNFGGKSPFTLSHQRMTIQAESTFELTVNFTPNREHDNFYDFIILKLSGLNIYYKILLTGQGWEISTLIQNVQQKPFSYGAPSFLEPPIVEFEKSLKKLGISSETKKEDIPPEAILGIIKRQYHFATVSTTWISTIADDKKTWKIIPIDISLANLKPSYKIDQGKKGSFAEFAIESVNHTFIYDEILHDYIIAPKKPDSTGIVLSLEPINGSFEIGTSKSLKLESRQPTLSFWQNCLKRQENTKPSMELNDRINLDDCLGIYMKETEVMRSVEEFEITKPVYMEQCFKIVFKNGYRFVEPKGQQLPIEERTFYLKVIVEPPLSE